MRATSHGDSPASALHADADSPNHDPLRDPSVPTPPPLLQAALGRAGPMNSGVDPDQGQPASRSLLSPATSRNDPNESQMQAAQPSKAAANNSVTAASKSIDSKAMADSTKTKKIGPASVKTVSCSTSDGSSPVSSASRDAGPPAAVERLIERIANDRKALMTSADTDVGEITHNVLRSQDLPISADTQDPRGADQVTSTG